MNISKGQKQLLTIASHALTPRSHSGRATSNVDTGRNKIRPCEADAAEDLLRNCHRLSTIQGADNILVIDQETWWNREPTRIDEQEGLHYRLYRSSLIDNGAYNGA